MSAQLSPNPTRPTPRRRPTLRSVPRPVGRLARTPFLMVLAGILAIGMVGLLLLNTTLQNQAFQASELKRTAAEMNYKQGELEAAVAQADSVSELSRRASQLGMRPHREVAYVVVGEDKVIGEAKPADGMYLPSARYRTQQEKKVDSQSAAVNGADNRRRTEQKALEKTREKLLAEQAAKQQAAQEELRKQQEEAARQVIAQQQGQQAPNQQAPAAPQAQNQAAQNQAAPNQPAPNQAAQQGQAQPAAPAPAGAN